MVEIAATDLGCIDGHHPVERIANPEVAFLSTTRIDQALSAVRISVGEGRPHFQRDEFDGLLLAVRADTRLVGRPVRVTNTGPLRSTANMAVAKSETI
jgi:hypothetical protein